MPNVLMRHRSNKYPDRKRNPAYVIWSCSTTSTSNFKMASNAVYSDSSPGASKFVFLSFINAGSVKEGLQFQLPIYLETFLGMF
jgi:hypothetical protein